MSDIAVALWATNLGHPVNTLDEWVSIARSRVVEAARAGHRLLVLPEYVCAQWLHFMPKDTPPSGEIAFMAALAPAALDLIHETSQANDIAVLAGSMPHPVSRGYANRATLLLPDGRRIAQDKLVLTPGERDRQAWSLVPGDTIRVVEWEGLRLATITCLDIEQPDLAARLQALDLDLVLVPSMTSRATGYHRVHACARARAVELMTAVAVAGTVGRQPDGSTNVGGAAVYLPCEPGLADDGIMTALGPLSDHYAEGPVLSAHGVPLMAIRHLRRASGNISDAETGGAEVWPGPWSAHGIDFTGAD